MQKRAKTLIIAATGVLALGVIAAIAGPPIYRDFFAAPAAEVPTLSTDDSTFSQGAPESLDPAELSGEWAIAEGSVAGYRVDEVLNGTPVTVTGRTSEVNGALTVNGLTLESAEFEVDTASIATDQGARDRYFRDQALRVSAHPKATFVLTEAASLEDAPQAGEIVEQSLTGELTIAGITQTVTFAVQLRYDGDTARVAGQIPIVFADFGVEAPNLGFVSVEPQGFVEFELIATRG